MKINKGFTKLENSYLFSRINEKVKNYKAQNPDKNIIKLSIGDVTLPLTAPVVDALKNASAEMGKAETFRGYGEEQGYEFLREAIKGYYAEKGVTLGTDEIFVSDGAKSDIGNILDLFDYDNTVLVPDPVYPVYVDTNIMASRKIIFMKGDSGNGFLPMPDDSVKVDIIYLCSPNNPTGAVYTKEQLAKWIAYAKKCDAVILFDSAYERFVGDKTLPTSIFQVEGAEDCAIEFCSFSKTAGFTGTRCGYTVVPKALERCGVSLNRMWLRRQTTKFNGVPYIVQRGAAAVFTEECSKQIDENIAYYMENARTISSVLEEMGVWYTGGKNSPYIWLKVPEGKTSWEFFDYLLENTGVVGTPGSGFGECGEGYFRLTAFGSHENTAEAMRRIKALGL